VGSPTLDTLNPILLLFWVRFRGGGNRGMDGIKLLSITIPVQNTKYTRLQPSCRRLQHRNSDTKRLRLTLKG
jgi:hypothetical protein